MTGNQHVSPQPAARRNPRGGLSGNLRRHFSRQSTAPYFTGQLAATQPALAFYPLTPHVALQRQLAKRGKRQSHKAAAPLAAADILRAMQPTKEEITMPASPEEIVSLTHSSKPLDVDMIWHRTRQALFWKYDRTRHLMSVNGLHLNTYDPSHKCWHVDSAQALEGAVEKEVSETLKAICGFAVTVKVRVIGQQAHYERIVG